MRESLRQVEETPAPVASEIRDAASAVVQDVEKLGKAARDAVKERGHDLYEKGQSKFREASREVEGYVQKYPLRVLLGALGVGIVLGLIQRARK